MGQAETPQILYKYAGPDRIEIVESGLVRFSPWSALNDPNEFSVRVDERGFLSGVREVSDQQWKITASDQALNDQILAKLKAHRIYKQIEHLPPDQKQIAETQLVAIAKSALLPRLPAIKEQFNEALAVSTSAVHEVIADVRNGSLLIFCCSEDPLSGPMWAHYAQNHAGFQIGFDPSLMFPDKRLPRKILYSDDVPLINDDARTLPDFVRTKAKSWSYEQEWRFFVDRESCLTTQRTDIHLVRYDPAALAEITFGLRATADFRSRARKAMAKANPDARCYQIKVDKENGHLFREETR